MIKKLIKGMIVGGALMAMVAPAMADQEINIFGASAQYKYWTKGAPGFLTSIGCADDDIWSAEGDLGDRDNGVSICHADLAITDADGVAIADGDGAGGDYDGEDIIIRYSTFASVEGILASLEQNPSDADEDECGTDNPELRLMGEVSTALFGNTGNGADIGTLTALECTDVSMGTSDIDPECFSQYTYGPIDSTVSYADASAAIGTGDYYAPEFDTDDWWVREFNYGDQVPDDYTGMTREHPLVVPFAFFVNDSNPVISDGTSVTDTMNLTRPMAQLLLSGQIFNWSKFYPSVSENVVVCIRHAGSGTHATTDWAVVNPQGINQVAYMDGDMYVTFGLVVETYTNKGSSEEAACVAQFDGAIGYADADKKGELYDGNADSVCESGICRTQYQGYWATRDNIINGLYDYWAANVVFYNADDGEFTQALMTDFIDYMEDSDNLEGTGKEDFWASQGEMMFQRVSCKDGITPK